MAAAQSIRPPRWSPHSNLFAILSTPVRIREGVFAVAIGTNVGIEVREFASLREATTRGC